MDIKEAIDKYIAKGTKSSMILELLVNNKFVTSTDIILFGFETNKSIFTTSPHKIIENIRKHFGADFVQDVDIEFIRTFYPNGQKRTMKDTYKRYFLNLEGI